MDNNNITETGTQNNKTSPAATTIFYIFGIFCSLLSLLGLSSGLSSIKKYDVETTGIITDGNYYYNDCMLTIEFTMNGEKQTRFVTVDYADASTTNIEEGDMVVVKYPSKSTSTHDAYFPELEPEPNYNWLIGFVVPTIIAAVCFIAPTNSSKAASMFSSLKRFT